MNNQDSQEIHLVGKNHHVMGVELWIGTSDELERIAKSNRRNEIFEVTEETAKETWEDNDGQLHPEWPEGAGWYYSIGDCEYVRVDSRDQAIAAILTDDAHPLQFTVEAAKEILAKAKINPNACGLWHHNRYKVITAIRECLESYGLIEPEFAADENENEEEDAE